MAEVIAGAAATASSSGTGAPWAIPFILHGVDQVVAGAAQAITGEQTHSRLEKVVTATAEAAGVPPQKAEIVGSVVDAVTGLVLTAGVGSGPALTRAVATEAKVVNALAKEVEVGTVVAKIEAFKTWTSPSGLVYGQGSEQGNRVLHILEHAVANPAKPAHSIFSVPRSKIIELVDEAWITKAGQGILQTNGNRTWMVDMGRQVGTGGQTAVQIVVRDGTSEIITAFPK